MVNPNSLLRLKDFMQRNMDMIPQLQEEAQTTGDASKLEAVTRNLERASTMVELYAAQDSQNQPSFEDPLGRPGPTVQNLPLNVPQEVPSDYKVARPPEQQFTKDLTEAVGRMGVPAGPKGVFFAPGAQEERPGQKYAELKQDKPPGPQEAMPKLHPAIANSRIGRGLAAVNEALPTILEKGTKAAAYFSPLSPLVQAYDAAQWGLEDPNAPATPPGTQVSPGMSDVVAANKIQDTVPATFPTGGPAKPATSPASATGDSGAGDDGSDSDLVRYTPPGVSDFYARLKAEVGEKPELLTLKNLLIALFMGPGAALGQYNREAQDYRAGKQRIGSEVFGEQERGKRQQAFGTSTRSNAAAESNAELAQRKFEYEKHVAGPRQELMLLRQQIDNIERDPGLKPEVKQAKVGALRQQYNAKVTYMNNLAVMDAVERDLLR